MFKNVVADKHFVAHVVAFDNGEKGGECAVFKGNSHMNIRPNVLAVCRSDHFLFD